MSTLYIIATPIGNLEDITLRALRVFKEVDGVYAEDTRETSKLLRHFDISKPLDRYDEHSHGRQLEKIISLLEEGKDIAYVSDAGTPGISDPGAMLVRDIRKYFKNNEVAIIPIPGASAITTLMSVAGITDHSFTFLGFLPHKKGRETLFNKISRSKRTIMFYESPHRIMKTLNALAEKLDSTKLIVIGRELTKIHEEVISGSAKEVHTYYEEHQDKVRGEFVVLVSR